MNEKSSMITLLTDFGLSDAYVGIMKGVIWQISPQVKIVDITHNIPPQDIYTASLTLKKALPFFPKGTVHTAVIDPGVGTLRRPIAMVVNGHYFVGPDNGLFSHIIVDAKKKKHGIKIYHLNNQRYWLKNISNVFHGRDIFAPSAAHIAQGIPLDDMGIMINDPVELKLPRLTISSNTITGEIIQIDHFGNIETNIEKSILKGVVNLKIKIKGLTIERIINTFAEGEDGEIVAIFDSSDYLSINKVNGNAAKDMKVSMGTKIEIILRS